MKLWVKEDPWVYLTDASRKPNSALLECWIPVISLPFIATLLVKIAGFKHTIPIDKPNFDKRLSKYLWKELGERTFSLQSHSLDKQSFPELDLVQKSFQALAPVSNLSSDKWDFQIIKPDQAPKLLTECDDRFFDDLRSGVDLKRDIKLKVKLKNTEIALPPLMVSREFLVTPWS